MKESKPLPADLAIINIYTLIAIIYCSLSSILFFVIDKNFLLSAIHVAALIAIAFSYFLFTRAGRLAKAKNTILITGTLVVLSLFVSGGWSNTGYLWTFAYIPFAFFLSGKKDGLFWVLIFFCSCLIIVLFYLFHIITLPYPTVSLINFFSVFMVLIVCIYFFQKNSMLQYEKQINERTEALRLSEQKYRQLFHNNPLPMWVLDLSAFSFIDVNNAALHHYGYSREEFLSMTALNIRPEKEKERFRKLDHSTRTTPYNTGIWEHLKKDGTTIQVEVIAHEIIFEGKPSRIVLANDVTEKIKTEKELKRSFKEISDYKYALDESCIVAITDQKGIIHYVNDNFCKISKYSREDLIGQDHRIINSGFHPAEFIRNLWVTIAHGKIWRGEMRNKAKDGTIYWVDTTIVPFLNEEGKPYQYVAIRADITQKKITENLQKELEEKVMHQTTELAGIFEKITDGFIMLDRNFCYTYANKKIGEIIGRDATALIGRCVWDEFPEAVGSATYHAMQKAMTEQVYAFNIDYYPPLNLWQENHIYPTAEGISVFVRDISEQKKAEQTIKESEKIYKAIASSIPGSAICLLDSNYRCLLIEGDMLNDLGYTKEHVLGNKAQEILDPVQYAAIRPILQRVFEGETITISVTHRDYHISARLVPLKDEHDAVYAAMVAAIDVTELKDAEKRIAELNIGLENKVIERTAQLDTAVKELEAFSYSVSHDLRAPLRAISGYSNILIEDYDDKLDAEGNRILNSIINNTTRMGQLIDDLLNFSRISRKDIIVQRIDMRSVVETCAAELLPDGLEEKYRIYIDDLPGAEADPAMIRQVWVNLIHNAIKYSMKKETPVIKIGSTKSKEKNIYYINDNGAGFDMQYANKLFGVFQRLHSNEEFEGTGVGLALVNRIILKHNGKIWAEGEVEKGATFYFSLDAIKK